MIRINVNKRVLEAEKGETILSALRNNGIHVPTICSMKDLSPTGACRMCVVELEGVDSLVPACSFEVEEQMNIKTHSPRVLRARKTNVELLLSNHPDDCLYCGRNGSCELQDLALDLNVRERRIPGGRIIHKIDKSSPAIVRDGSKCILCGRCVRMCEEVMGTATLDFAFRGNDLRISTALANPLNFSNCISCGQCVVNCPTGALTENVQYPELEAVLYDREKIVSVQYSIASAISLAELLGIKPGKDINSLLNAALKLCGFDFVFETAFGGDVMIVEQSAILQERLRKNEGLPLLTSSCPAVITYIEQFMPELIPHLSPLKSPHQILGSLVKTWFAKEQNIVSNNIFSVHVSPCTAAKSEAHRVELQTKGFPVIDSVMTTRELAHLIRLNGIDMNQLNPEEADMPFGLPSSAGKICVVAGGELEASMRTLFHEINRKELPGMRLGNLRISKQVKEVSVILGNEEIRIASVSGMKNAISLLEEVAKGQSPYKMIEIMACPDGCVNGGGQAIQLDEQITRNRIKSVYEEDNQEQLRMAHTNDTVLKLYKEFLREPASKESNQLLHTTFSAKEVLK